MADDNKTGRKLDDNQIAALATSATILIFFVVYWAFQIDTTYELLAMAYGW